MLTVRPAQDSTVLLRELSGLPAELEEREMTSVSVQQPQPCQRRSVPEPCPPAGLQDREIPTVPTMASAV